MKETKYKEEQALGPQLALQRYLDDLLHDANIDTDQPESEEAPSFETSEQDISDELESDTPTGELGESIEEKSPSTDEEMAPHTDDPLSMQQFDTLVEEGLPQVVEEPEPEPEPEPSKFVAKTEPLPWAKSRFECLLFYVGGLKMAVPLIELGGIHKTNQEKLTSIFGQPDWFMGILNVGDYNLRTVDTAKWVMPDHYEGELKEHFEFVIQLDRSDWGVACEKVAEAISLEPSQVKWRTDRTKRPWLAGTVIDHMCAILDIQGFIELLDDPKNGFKSLKK